MTTIKNEPLRSGNAWSPTIKIIGVGGAGNNLIDFLYRDGPPEVELIAANTDAQALDRCKAHTKLLLGNSGLGAGGDPVVASRAANGSRDQIAQAINGAHLIFLVAGMGGGTGTGASPVIADVARTFGIFTIGITTHPFGFEGTRCAVANDGRTTLASAAPSLISIHMENLAKELGDNASMDDFFKQVDQLCCDAMTGVIEIIRAPHLVNTTWENLCLAMTGGGSVATAYAEGTDRAHLATLRALSMPSSAIPKPIEEAAAIFVTICAAGDIKKQEIDEVMNTLHTIVKEPTVIYPQINHDGRLAEKIKITVMAMLV